MIRRVVSTILFELGGWMLMTELFTAFIDVEPGASDNAVMLGTFAVLAGLPLLLGAWASPGRRWQELGLTILIAAGIALFCGISILAVLSDPGFKPFMPPMPEIELAPVFGGVNLLIVAGVGFFLWRWGREHAERAEPDLERIFGDD